MLEFSKYKQEAKSAKEEDKEGDNFKKAEQIMENTSSQQMEMVHKAEYQTPSTPRKPKNLSSLSSFISKSPNVKTIAKNINSQIYKKKTIGTTRTAGRNLVSEQIQSVNRFRIRENSSTTNSGLNIRDFDSEQKVKRLGPNTKSIKKQLFKFGD
jgi:DNA topoisomerase IA